MFLNNIVKKKKKKQQHRQHLNDKNVNKLIKYCQEHDFTWQNKLIIKQKVNSK